MTTSRAKINFFSSLRGLILRSHSVWNYLKKPVDFTSVWKRESKFIFCDFPILFEHLSKTGPNYFGKTFAIWLLFHHMSNDVIYVADTYWNEWIIQKKKSSEIFVINLDQEPENTNVKSTFKISEINAFFERTPPFQIRKIPSPSSDPHSI